jgi:hypothetical protein
VSIWEHIDALYGAVDGAIQRGDRPTPEQLARWRRAMVERYSQDVLVRRFIRETRSGTRNTAPWQALAEKRYAALVACRIGDPDIDVRWWPGQWRPEDEDLQSVSLAVRLGGLAVPYLWSEDVEAMVRDLPLPRHVVGRNLLPHPWMFFSYEVAYGPTGPTGDGWTDWCLIEDARDCIHITAPLVNRLRGDPVDWKATRISVASMRLPYGLTWPDDAPADRREGWGLILRRLAFINSPYVETIRHRLPRPIRREAKRFRQDVPETDADLCRTVVLRRAAAEAQARHDADQAAGPDWRGHWWVSGHFRAQWYPSDQSHRVIWVAPYVKGDLGKPLLEKTYAVVR